MKLRKGWRNLLEHFKAPVRSVRVDDLPDALEPRRLYLIGEEQEKPWQAALICPCGCGSTIRLSLVPNDRPRWKAGTGLRDVASLSPSVARQRGCSAHFILTDGHFRWV